MIVKHGGRQKIGLALGSGSSRGWSHIGIIRELAALDIEPDIICGTSAGAIVGAAYCAGNLDSLEHWVCSLSSMDVVRFLDVNLSFNGFIDAKRLRSFFNKYVCNEDLYFDDLNKKFAAVSTELETGREVWFRHGPVIDSVWASMALPGLFPPIKKRGKWLVDGGLVNPVPVSVCKALGADIVIAVNLNGDVVGKHFVKPTKVASPIEGRDEDVSVFHSLKTSVLNYSTTLFESNSDKDAVPSLFEAISGSFNIVQDRITRSRMAGDPPDIMLTPKLSHIGLLEFHRAKEAIDEGKACVKRMLPEIKYVLGLD